MRCSFDCPYLGEVKSGIIRCELAKITPPDAEARAEFLAEHCGHATKYKECPFYKIMDNYYKRKYSEEVDKW
jgi:hypothetical protein